MKLYEISLIFLLLYLGWGCQNKPAGNGGEKAAEATDYQAKVTDQLIPDGVSLHDAALTGNTDRAVLLMKSNPCIDTTDEEGHTPLMLAAFNGHTEIASLLIGKGANVNSKDKKKLTPLHFAASGPYPAMVKLLLEHGADINSAENSDRFTPLMYAAAEGHLEVVKTLVNFGADPALKDKDGDTAESFARRNNHSGVAAFLHQSGTAGGDR